MTETRSHDGAALDVDGRSIYVGNTDLDQALALWQKALSERGLWRRVATEAISVDLALGRVTAEPVHAARSAPFYNAAAMDGIAVCFRDTVGASESRPQILPEGCFHWVNTGNAMPAGCDAVIMIEDVQPHDDGSVEIISAAPPWQHVRTIGEDIVATELILPAGHCIRPIDLGAMLATCVDTVTVRCWPKAQVIPTGSDVRQPGQATAAGDIIEFNGRILCGYLAEWGAIASRGDIVADDPHALALAVRKAVVENDLVIINAGASAGSRDFTLRVLAELGTVVVHGVNIKPGKPVILAIVENTPVIGLPGYPVSAIVTQRLFVRPLLRQMLGCDLSPAVSVSAVLSRPTSSRLGVEEFLRVRLGRVGGKLIATPAGRGAGQVMSMVLADAIMRIPAGSEGVAAGETVTVEMQRRVDEVENTLVFIGSHDNILDVLANLLNQQEPPCRLSSAHVGSMGGIMAIKRGEAHLAGTHLLDEETGEYNVSFIKRFLADVPLQLVNLAHRQQGLLVPKGNPLDIVGFADLTRDTVRFVNRQRGAGTRLLTDLYLKRLAIEPQAVNGYGREEYTHMGVASAVASGNADVGVGIRAAAVALELDFVPVALERYDLIIPTCYRDDEKVAALLRTMREDEHFRRTVAGMGGYDLVDCGRVMYEQ